MSAQALAADGASTATGRTAWRLAAIVIFLGLPLGAAALAGFAAMAGSESSEVADHAEDTARAIIHQLDRKPATQKPVDTSALYLSSPSASLARAELQALAGRLIEAGGGRIIEMQSTDAAEPDASGHVCVDVTFDAANAGLLESLYAAETGLPLLPVPRLEARAETAVEGQIDSGGPLRVTMTVQGSWKALAP